VTEARLSVLLSQALVAWVVEADNTFEARMPHVTSVYGPTAGQPPGPWLTSVAMWFGCLQHLDDDGITVGELERRARGGTNLAGMQRWQYLTAEPEPVRHAFKPETILRPTAAGRAARAVWAQVLPEVDARWADRFGAPGLQALREELGRLDGLVAAGLPDFLPILGHGLWNRVSRTESLPEPPDACLVSLLARPLLSLALEFEHSAPVSLAVAANLLRVLEPDRVPVRDLPTLTGVAFEGNTAALEVLERQGLVEVGAADGNRWKYARLTAMGVRVRSSTDRLLRSVEASWQERFGTADLRAGLERIVGDGSPTASPLADGLVPHPDGWRAGLKPAATLPHFPLVLHRGGFPDGS
jgi:DNA-binding MarR family transcriptional regulator